MEEDVAEDEVEDDEVEDEDVKREGVMMLRMMLRRGRKMLMWGMTMLRRRPIPRPRTILCESLRSRNACQHFTRATSHENLQEKCRGPDPRPTLCASLRGRTAFQHFQKPLYTEISGKNAAPQKSAQNADSHFVRACSVEMHANIISEI